MAPNSILSPQDSAHLEWARRIARRGWGRVHPNPVVGCVLVREGRVVGEGFHEVFGGPHAEIVALERALGEAEGATAYVSLEPCNHQGKTPPCAEALISAGVTRVVYGAADPGEESGGGAETLRAAGVEVVGPVWSPATGRAENPAFQHAARHETPFVALKLAMSLDARIAATSGERTRVTGVDAEREVHRLRTGFDAVMVGAGTVVADDPRLTVRLVPAGRQATRRILLLPDAELPVGAAVLRDVPDAPLHVFCREGASEAAMEHLEAAGAHVHPVPGTPEALDLEAVLGVSRGLGIRSILCEGGRMLADSLLRERRVQRLYLFVAPVTFGEDGVPAFPADAGALVWSDFQPAMEPEAFGRDTLLVFDRQEG
jgi:diaminohydroxyphosphoribosylaminopyrimidine deaminase/5-amino-6-(5-phosphoribosylamino)uracil reductase